MQHVLKIQPSHFDAVLSGDKTFEIRDNSDRGFQKGDTVVLMEHHQHCVDDDDRFTGRKVEREITYVTNYMQKQNMVVFSMAAIGSNKCN